MRWSHARENDLYTMSNVLPLPLATRYHSRNTEQEVGVGRRTIRTRGGNAGWGQFRKAFMNGLRPV